MHTASSTVNPLHVVDHEALVQAISPARLRTYLAPAGGDLSRALDLYVWNACAGAALFPLLQANEIALRNAVDRALAGRFGDGWPYAPGFLRSLPTRSRRPFEEARSRLVGVGRIAAARDDVVAAQSYGFWVILLTSRFEARIWSAELRRCFPHASAQVGRATVHAAADSIRRLRNRIAHHEPLLREDLPGARRRASEMVAWISREKATWMHARWPIPERLLRPP